MSSGLRLIGATILQLSSVVLFLQSRFVGLQFLRVCEPRPSPPFEVLLFGLLLGEGTLFVQFHAGSFDDLREQRLRGSESTSTMGCTS